MADAVFQHNLGDRGKDRISGQTGIVTARVEHLFGCARYWLEPEELKDGKPVDGRWIDEGQLDVIKPAVIAAPHVRVVAAEAVTLDLRRTGGPMTQPSSSVRPSDRR